MRPPWKPRHWRLPGSVCLCITLIIGKQTHSLQLLNFFSKYMKTVHTFAFIEITIIPSHEEYFLKLTNTIRVYVKYEFLEAKSFKIIFLTLICFLNIWIWLNSHLKVLSTNEKMVMMTLKNVNF